MWIFIRTAIIWMFTTKLNHYVTIVEVRPVFIHIHIMKCVDNRKYGDIYPLKAFVGYKWENFGITLSNIGYLFIAASILDVVSNYPLLQIIVELKRLFV